MQKQKNPFSLMAFIRPHRAGFIASTVLAVLSVASGMVPYFAVAKMVNLLISAEKNFSIYLTWGMVALIAYLLKSVLHGISTRCSHEATFHVLSELRRAVADKLTHVSMGYLTDTPSGRLKTTMVERVEQMEVPLAHIIPEMTSNLLVPLAIVVCLFALDWRMALVSLITIPTVIRSRSAMTAWRRSSSRSATRGTASCCCTTPSSSRIGRSPRSWACPGPRSRRTGSSCSTS